MGDEADRPVAAPERSGRSDSARAELGDAPPFLSWRAIYVILLGALAIEAGLGLALTVLYR
jgi:hypothetical protein